MVVKARKLIKVCGSERSVYVQTVLGLLEHAMKYPCELVYSETNTSGGRLENGTWTGLYEMLNSGECDVAIHDFPLIQGTTMPFDLAFPHFFDEVNFLTNKFMKISQPFAVIYPFSMQLWVAVLIFFIFMSLVFYKVMSSKRKYLDVVFDIFGSIILQPLEVTPQTKSDIFVLISWLLGVMMITFSYQGTLLSHLTVPSLFGIRNIQDLSKAVQEGTYISKSFPNKYYVDVFLNHTNENMRMIGTSMLEASSIFINFHAEDVINFFKENKGALIYGKKILIPFQNFGYLSKDAFFQISGALGIRKGFCCKSDVDNAVIRILQTGLFEKSIWSDYRMRYEMIVMPFISEAEESDQLTPLQLNDLATPFYLLIFGYILSFVAYIAEKFVYKTRVNAHKDRRVKKGKRNE